MRAQQYLALALAATMAAACGGGGASPGGGPTEPPGGGGGPNTPSFANLTVSPASGTVAVGGSFQLTATATDAAGAAVNGLPDPTYESADPSRATVSATGLVTGVAAGTVTIRAILAAGGVTDTASATLTVTPPAPPAATFASLSLAPDAGAVQVGGTLQLIATPRDQNGAAMAGLPAAAFATSDASRATVSAAGVVTGVAAGPVTITASVTAGGVTRQATASLTVAAPPHPNSASVQALRGGYTPASATIGVGGTVTWTMADDDHTVTFDGAAPSGGNVPRTEEGEQVSRTFTTAGTYAYHCDRHDEMRGTVEVKTQTGGGGTPVFTSLTISPSSGSVQVGGTLQLTATPRDQNGAAMGGLGAAQFATSSASIATVSAGGTVTGVAAGTATITATLVSGGATRTATATVTVTTTAPPPPPPPGNGSASVTTVDDSFSPQTVTIAPGGTVTWTISGSTHNVTFSGAAPTGGNIPDTRTGSFTRTFPTAGSYSYQCTRHGGMTGQVVVQ